MDLAKKNGFEKFEKRYLLAKGFGILIVSTPFGIMVQEEAVIIEQRRDSNLCLQHQLEVDSKKYMNKHIERINSRVINMQ